MTRAAIIAVIFSAVVVLIYIMFVFRQVPNTFRYGTTAVIALVHDLLLVLGFWAITGVLLGWEVDALFLTAVLTVAGFSLQDTIVLFDRMRENIARRQFEKIDLIANRSIVETIHRSLVTQVERHVRHGRHPAVRRRVDPAVHCHTVLRPAVRHV